MVSVASVLRWGDLPNTAPPATVLTNECLVGAEAKTKTMESLKVDHAGGVITHSLKKNGYLMGAKCSASILGNLIGTFGLANR